MRLLAPADLNQCRPFHIASGPSESGPRLGGRAPALPPGPKLRKVAHYVGTFPFAVEPETHVSVYVNCDTRALLRAMNEPVQKDDRIVAVRHLPVPRGLDRRFASELSEHPLIAEAACQLDEIDNQCGGTVHYSSHKLGGRPYCIQEPELEGAADLLAQGYLQAVQLDFPGGGKDALVSGSWPFGDGLFNLFLHPSPNRPTYWAFQK